MARLFPLSGAAPTKVPSDLPSIRHAHEATVICLKEVSEINDADFEPFAREKGHRRDWLSLALKELLGLPWLNGFGLLCLY
jgi:hypothetical protein